MSRFKQLKIVLILCPFLAACAATDSGKMTNIAPLKTRDTSVGTVLTDSRGFTLYTYKNDPAGQSKCAGRCARKWPPVVASIEPAAGGDLSVIHRKDGVMQYAWRGHALYRWTKDKEPGQVTGHNLGEVWFAARP